MRPLLINIINFIRAVEPRQSMDLVEPVREQIRLLTAQHLPATWLLQFDAMINGSYLRMLRDLPAGHEIGGWFEIVQPLAERAGIPWRGRYAWDWHANVGFSIGYSPVERVRLVDAYMSVFHGTFGRYPASVGSWLLDARTLAYLSDRYGVIASCICKDQQGTDGYTLWGGYWNQAYYPSRDNAFMPAQNTAAQIPLPVFRMLGSDPIDQYDAGFHAGTNCIEMPAQAVVTLEPVYRDGGGDPRWVRWFFDQLTRHPSLAFQYAQVGQENSFGWSAMAAGYADQVRLLAGLRNRHPDLRVETLADSGRWFRRAHAITPSTAVSALGDAQGRHRGSIWYNSRFYRANLHWTDGQLWIRDLHLFDESYRERYLDEPCTRPDCSYDTLPISEGFLWSGDGVRSGFRLLYGEAAMQVPAAPALADVGNGDMQVTWTDREGRSGEARFHADALALACAGSDWSLDLAWSLTAAVPFVEVCGGVLACRHAGHDYSMAIVRGTAVLDVGLHRLRLKPASGWLELRLRR